MTGIKVFRTIWKSSHESHDVDSKFELIICPPFYGAIAIVANALTDAIVGSTLCATHVFNKDCRNRNIKMKDILKLTTNPMNLLDLKDEINSMAHQHASTNGIKPTTQLSM